MSQTNRPTPSGWSPGSIMQDMYTAWRMFWDPRVPTILKVLFPVGALLYWISPIDLLPGLPFDDIALLIVAIRLFVQMIPAEMKDGQNPQASGGYGTASSKNGSDYGDDNTIDTTWRVIED